MLENMKNSQLLNVAFNRRLENSKQEGCDTSLGTAQAFLFFVGKLRKFVTPETPDCNDSGMAGDTTIPFKPLRIACIAFKCFCGTFIPQTDNKHDTSQNKRSQCHTGKIATSGRMKKPGDYSGSTGKSGGLPTIRFKAAFDANGISISL